MNMEDKNAFVLQGGGALGAYQAGACQNLLENNIEPNWLIGISIGAINSSIIAGNKPEDRINNLISFWETISKKNNISTSLQINPFLDNSFKKLFSEIDTHKIVLEGQNGFFKPRNTIFNFLNNFNKYNNKDFEELSYYETNELKETLLKFVNFDIINSKKIRLSLGVVNVKTGEFQYFDNLKEKITAEHIMASGALPPAFPAIKIKNEYYWDGGISENSAIKKILEEKLINNWNVYQIDLWRNKHNLPNNFDELNQRIRDIQFSSNNKEIDLLLKERKEEKENLIKLLNDIPDNLRNTDYYKKIEEKILTGDININRIIYQGMEHETKDRTHQFNKQLIQEHWLNGYNDMLKLLNKKTNNLKK